MHFHATRSAPESIEIGALIFAGEPISPDNERSQNPPITPPTPNPGHDISSIVCDCHPPIHTYRLPVRDNRPPLHTHRCPLREPRWITFRACRPQPPPPRGGAGRGAAAASRVRGCRPDIERSRKRKKQGCVPVPRKPVSDGFRDHWEQPCSARPSHLRRSPTGSPPKSSAAPCGRPGLGINGVCDAGLRPSPRRARPAKPHDKTRQSRL